MLDRLRSSAPLWRRALRRRRRALALLTLAALLAAVLPTLLPPSARGVDVIVAARPLSAGAIVEAGDLRRVRTAPQLVPDGALAAPEDAVGRTLGDDVAAGSTVLPSHLSPPGEEIALEGRTRMVIPLDAALVPHVRRGTELRIICAVHGEESAGTVRAQVLEAPAPGGGGAGDLLTADVPVQIVVLLDPSDARDVAFALREGWAVTTVLS